MSIQVTDGIRNALRAACEDAGGQKKFARKSGVGISSIANWLGGAAPAIREATWERIYPHLKAYLMAGEAPAAVPADPEDLDADMPDPELVPEPAEEPEQDHLLMELAQVWDRLDIVLKHKLLIIAYRNADDDAEAEEEE